jgi:hypothetical protein
VPKQWVIDGLLFWAFGMSIMYLLSILFWQQRGVDLIDENYGTWSRALISLGVYGAMLGYALVSTKWEHATGRNPVHAKH